jgi:hypothetical protein
VKEALNFPFWLILFSGQWLLSFKVFS